MSNQATVNPYQMGREFVKAANSLLSPPAKVQSPLEAGKEYLRSGDLARDLQLPDAISPNIYSPEQALLYKEWYERSPRERNDPVLRAKMDEAAASDNERWARLFKHKIKARRNQVQPNDSTWVGPRAIGQGATFPHPLTRPGGGGFPEPQINPGEPLGPGKMTFGLQLQNLLQSAKSTGSSALSSAKDWASDNRLYANAARVAGIGSPAALVHLATRKRRIPKDELERRLREWYDERHGV